MNQRYSVLIPLFYKDNPIWFSESLNSVVNQTIPPNEILIIHEYPNSKELDSVIESVKSEHSGIEIVDVLDDSLIGSGLGGVLAAGVERCSNELIARMDSDDVSMRDRCERQMKVLVSDPNLTMVGGWVDEFEDSTNDVISVRRVPGTTDEIKRFANVRNPFNHPTVMFKKSAVLSVGNYACLPRCEDYDLWVRMLSAGQQMMNLQEPILFYRTNEGQRRRRKDRKAYDIRRGIKRGMRERREMSLPTYAWTMALDFANYHAPMFLFEWSTKHLLRSKSEDSK